MANFEIKTKVEAEWRTTKKAIAFDLDDTLTESKVVIDPEMAELFSELLKLKKVAVISGQMWSQFEKQLISGLHHPEVLHNLYIFPANGASVYNYRNGKWTCLSHEDLPPATKERIILALNGALEVMGYQPEKLYGEMLEDRGGAMTFSGLGQDAPLELKKVWDPKNVFRSKLQKLLQKSLPDLEIEIAGTTSVNISPANRTKMYAMAKFKKLNSLEDKDILFIGDAVFLGGNDYSVLQAGIDTMDVTHYPETKEIIRTIISAL
jgi:phosphomannomutase